jgi:tetratricopeptide (TPR) repeat protein
VIVTLLVWLRLISPNFELYTNAGEAAGRRTLTRFEQIRRVFRPAGPALPVRIYLFGSESDMRPFRPSEATISFFQGGPERDFIVIQDTGVETPRVAFHEYVHLVLNHSSARLPRWFEEGTAEFYSTLESAAGRLRVGRAIPAHLRTLATAPWLPAPVFFSVDRGSPYYNERSKVGIFYAQSWAMVHMLNLSPEYRAGMPRFTEGATFLEAFGRTRDDAVADLRRYLSSGNLPYADLAAVSAGEVPPTGVEKVDETGAALLLAELYLAVGKEKDAEKAYLKLERRQPESAGVQSALGALALRRGNYDEARRRLGRALELGSREASTHFEYAMLLRESGGAAADVAAHLRKTIELNPNYAEAHFLLGLMASGEKKYAEAVEHLNRAVSILPRQSYFWHALAVAYHELGDSGAARRAAYRALDNAATEQEASMAQAAIRMSGAAQPVPPAKPAASTPPSWEMPKGDARVEGVLRRIDCFSQGARVFVETAGRHLSVYIRNPGEVLLRNASSLTFQFTCGVQQPRRVSIEYITRPDARLGTAGDVTSIQFE